MDVEARIQRLEGAVGNLQADLDILRDLNKIGDAGSILNKVRFITEALLHGLCVHHGIGWGDKEPTLERMVGPLRSAKILTAPVAAHIRSIQSVTSPGSHFQEDRLDASHVQLAELALVEFMEWYVWERVSGTRPLAQGVGQASRNAPPPTVPARSRAALGAAVVLALSVGVGLAVRVGTTSPSPPAVAVSAPVTSAVAPTVPGVVAPVVPGVGARVPNARGKSIADAVEAAMRGSALSLTDADYATLRSLFMKMDCDPKWTPDFRQTMVEGLELHAKEAPTASVRQYASQCVAWAQDQHGHAAMGDLSAEDLELALTETLYMANYHPVAVEAMLVSARGKLSEGVEPYRRSLQDQVVSYVRQRLALESPTIPVPAVDKPEILVREHKEPKDSRTPELIGKAVAAFGREPLGASPDASLEALADVYATDPCGGETGASRTAHLAEWKAQLGAETLRSLLVTKVLECDWRDRRTRVSELLDAQPLEVVQDAWYVMNPGGPQISEGWFTMMESGLGDIKAYRMMLNAAIVGQLGQDVIKASR